MMIVDPFRFTGPATIEYIGEATRTSFLGTDHTFEAADIGDEGIRRRIYLAVHWIRATAAMTLVSGTIGGEAVTVHVQSDSVEAPPSGFAACGIVSAFVDAGTTADIVLTMSDSSGDVRVHVFRAENIIGGAAIDTDTAIEAGPSITLNCDAQANGIAIVAGNFVDPSTMTGATEAYDVEALVASYQTAGGSVELASAETGRAFTMDDGGITAGAPIRAMVAATFR